MPQGFHIENFGCRAARADGEALASGLSNLGLASNPMQSSEVVIVNTAASPLKLTGKPAPTSVARVD
jgi:threonylcarbamoyladenosine tRNA methylthiotransferase MtaB